MLTGDRLGPYEVISALGAGGMGEVYRATDTVLKRQVALKVLPPEVADDPERVARFQREAEVLASLNHPNVAHLYGIEKSNGTLALVMELVEGETLADRIAKGPILLDEALPIAKQIAEALEAAHEQGIIHRDLKPANVKVRDDGTVKVLDFGLAKALEPIASSGVAASALTNSPTITSPALMTGIGVLLGTAAYMSPEQAKGRPADHRSDVFSFGVVLYEMLTGRQPFCGETAPDVLASLLVRDADLTRLPPNLPTRLVEAIERALEKNPKRRWQAVGDLRAELDRIAISPRAALTPGIRRQPWRRGLPYLVGILVGSVVTGWMVWVVRPDRPALSRPVVRWMFTLESGQAFTNLGRRLLTISPDATQIVYVANQRLYLRSMSNLEARPIAGTDNNLTGVVDPVFSPDGRSVVFYAGRTLKKISLASGTVITLCEADLPFGISWTHDDVIVFGQGTKGIMRVPARGGPPTVVATVQNAEVASSPQLLPGGQAALFTVADRTVADWSRTRIVVQSLKSGERKPLIEGGSDGRYLPTGQIVYASGGSLFAVPFDLTRLAINGEPTRVLDGISQAYGTGEGQFSTAATGSLVYIPGPVTDASQASLAWIDRTGQAEPLSLPPGPYEYPRVAPPDGRYVAYDTDAGGEAVIWIAETSGAGAPLRLTLAGRNRVPVWSPDGTRLAFQSDHDGGAAIWWWRADGSSAAERLTTPAPGTSQVPNAWSSDGRTLLFDVVTGSDYSLWSLDLLTRHVTSVGTIHSRYPTSGTFSPDGRWMAYYDSSAETGLFIQPFPPTDARRYQITTAGGAASIHCGHQTDGNCSSIEGRSV
jgi:serine/threonine-protein kinase